MDALKSEYSNLIKNNKEKHLQSLGAAIANPQSSPKKYLTAMRKLLKKKITSVIPPILFNGLFILSSGEKGTIFNEYFKDQCTTLVTSSTLPTLVKSTNLSLNKITFKSKHECNGTRELSRQIGQDIHHFAYPYGSLDDVNVNGIMELKKNNYSSAVLNHPGSIFKGGKKSNFLIPRMGLTDETSKGRIDDLFLGKIHLRFNGVKKSIL